MTTSGTSKKFTALRLPPSYCRDLIGAAPRVYENQNVKSKIPVAARASPDVDFLHRSGLDEGVRDIAERAELVRRGGRGGEVAVFVSAQRSKKQRPHRVETMRVHSIFRGENGSREPGESGAGGERGEIPFQMKHGRESTITKHCNTFLSARTGFRGKQKQQQRTTKNRQEDQENAGQTACLRSLAEPRQRAK